MSSIQHTDMLLRFTLGLSTEINNLKGENKKLRKENQHLKELSTTKIKGFETQLREIRGLRKENQDLKELSTSKIKQFEVQLKENIELVHGVKSKQEVKMKSKLAEQNQERLKVSKAMYVLSTFLCCCVCVFYLCAFLFFILKCIFLY